MQSIKYWLFKKRDLLVFKLGIKPSKSNTKDLSFFIKKIEEFGLFFKKENKIDCSPEVLFDSNKKATKIFLLNRWHSIPDDQFRFWHTDWTLPEDQLFSWYPKNNIPFFPKIKIITTFNSDLLAFGPEIKIPWETGRMQYLSNLALNFYEQDNNTQTIYINFISQSLKSFFINCPYLGGVQWCNPMEVSIRAVNIIFTLSLLNDEPKLKYLFPEIISSLKNHSSFIKSYLETSATPNNHYLSNIVGLLYLDIFLSQKDLLEMKATIQGALNDFRAQMFDDGSFYEGSSSYHSLNLEMLDHIYLISDFLKIDLAEKSGLKEKATKLFFACSTKDSYLNIGDNDSAKFVFSNNLADKKQDHKKIIVQSFPDFGLIVAKTCNSLVSLRCFNYKKQLQPSGHFHDDQLSVSIKIDGEDILVDPGTGGYTSNSDLRNYLRDSSNHSTFSIQTASKDSSQLFQTKIPKIFKSNIFFKNDVERGIITMIGECAELYDEILLERSRVIKIFKKINSSGFESIEKIKIIDQVKASGKGKVLPEGIKVFWNFILAPNVLINQVGIRIISSIKLTEEGSFFSKNYLSVNRTSKLTGNLFLTDIKPSQTATTIIFFKPS